MQPTQVTAGDGATLGTRSGDSRVRVLSLARDAGYAMGGAEKVAYEFARRLDPVRFRSYLCTTRRPEPYRRELAESERIELERLGVKVLCLDRVSSSSVFPWTRLYRMMVRERIDVLHAHMPRASVPGAVLARLAQVPVVVSHEHGSRLEGKIIRPFLDRQIVGRMSTTILAVSAWDRRQLIEREGIPAERIDVLPNAIPPPPEESAASLEDLGVPPGTPLIGAIGRLYEVKGYDYLIRAVALLKARGRPVYCVIAGIGPEEQRLRDLIAELGVSGEVGLIGRRDDVPSVVRALDVAVMCSRWEGSPLAVIEYMALAAPIVATRVGGIPELIEDGVHGLLVTPEDPGALADGIQRLLDDRALAARLGSAARERQRTEYDLDVTVAKLERMYLELCARQGGAPALPARTRSDGP
jgi:glycosyltransferase involved in cell wall biosynthesis